MPAQAHVVGSVEKFCAQTWKTHTYTLELFHQDSGREGKTRGALHKFSSFRPLLSTVMLPWLVLHRGCFPKSHQPWCASNTQELMGQFVAESSYFPGHLQATLTLDKRPSCLSQLQFPRPWEVLCPGTSTPVLPPSYTQSQLRVRKVLLWNSHSVGPLFFHVL